MGLVYWEKTEWFPGFCPLKTSNLYHCTVAQMALKMPINSIIITNVAVRGILGKFHELISNSHLFGT